jgi:superfamily II RNA helicase
MILSQYAKELSQKVQRLKVKDTLINDFIRQLGLRHFQVQELIRDGLLDESLVNHRQSIRAESINNFQVDPMAILRKMPLSSLELQGILGVNADDIGNMINKRILRSYRKKKRGGQMRALFRLGQLLSNERAIQKEVEKVRKQVEQHKKNMIEKYQGLEDELTGKAVQTAERPKTVVPPKLKPHHTTPHLAPSDNKSYTLDPWQENAILAMERGEHVFVQAPTGAGKTAVVEHFLLRNLDSGVTLFYAVPIKALANDKFFDFCELYGQENIGINTGDITLNPDAPIVIGTTEIVRNILLDRPDAYQVIAYDEAQYLGDPERGGAWEESIIMSSPETLLVFLSGSVANADVVANWVNHIKGRTVSTFTETHRPVPLKFAFPYKDGFLEEDEWPGLIELGRKTHRSYYEDMPKFFKALAESDMTPVLLFMARRRDCEDVFKSVDDIDKDYSLKLKKELSTYPESSFLNLKIRRLIEKKGCAYHHSGLLPPEKRVIEAMAKKGLLRFISATMSLASGVNFSVRTCFISEFQRPGNGGTMQDLMPSEILQMWGRAGRRGLDTEGYVVPYMNVNQTTEFSNVEAYPEAIVRENFVSPVNLLSILNRYSVEVLEDLCQKSFSSYVEGTVYRVFSDPTMKREAGSICGSPTYELPPYRQGVYANMDPEELRETFRCTSCENLKKCTKTYEDKIKMNPLQRMVKHLKMNDFISPDFQLTSKGRLAERFHSDMGLLVAHDIENGRVRPENLVEYAASVSTSGHIDFLGTRQRDHLGIAKRIYPQFLFPNLWERQRGRPVFINWNPGAGVVARRWVNADDWDGFAEEYKQRNIQGDLFRSLMRTGELLRSMGHIRDLRPDLAEAAMVASKLIMRPPLIPEELFVLS